MSRKSTRKRSRAILWLIIIAIFAGFALGDPSQLRLGTDLKGGTELEFSLDLTTVPRESRASVATKVKDTIVRRLDGFGLRELSVTTSGSDRVFVQVPGSESVEIDRLVDLIVASGELSLHLVSPERFQQPAAKKAVKRRGRSTANA